MIPNAKQGSWPLFAVLGVTVYLHWSWLFILPVAWTMGGQLFSHPAWGLALYGMLFLIVTLHEFGHALACRSVGGHADTVMLWPLGGVAFVRPPARPGAMLWSIAAGPLVNVLLIPVTWVLVQQMVSQNGQPPTDLEQLVLSTFYINMALLAFNLLPIYPLDGGQILQALLWFFISRGKSLLIASSTGLVVAVTATVYLAIHHHVSLWLLVLAAFIVVQAVQGMRVAMALIAYERQLARTEQWYRQPWEV